MPNDTIYLSIIITAYNESKIILENIDEISQWLKSNVHKKFEVIVINDGSTDNMQEVLTKALCSRPWLNIVNHPTNLGRGAGIRSGFKVARGQFIICLDADLSYEPSHIKPLLEPLENFSADITLASPYHSAGHVSNVPAQRAFISKLGNKLLSHGFDNKLSTVTCIVRGFTKGAIDKLELINNGKELHLEVLQKASLLGLRIQEVPATLHWRDKKRGKSINRKVLPDFQLFKMRKTVLSHLVFNYITNPGVLLLIPLLTLLAIIFVGSSVILTAFLQNYTLLDVSFYQILRKTLIDSQLSLTITLFTSIILMVFVIFYFLSLQIKRYFEDTYILLSRINSKIKEFERNQ